MSTPTTLTQAGWPRPMSADAPRPLPRISILVMILLYVVTLGLYPAIWFLRRRAALNALDSPRKLARWPFYSLLGYTMFSACIRLAASPDAGPQVQDQSVVLLEQLVRIALGLIMILQAFRVREILEDHLEGSGPDDGLMRNLARESSRLSGLATFFLSVFYLQWVINQRIAAPR